VCSALVTGVSEVTRMTSSVGPGLDWIFAWESITAGSEKAIQARSAGQPLASINYCLGAECTTKTRSVLLHVKTYGEEKC